MTVSKATSTDGTIRDRASDTSRLVDIETVARYLGVKVRHMRRLVAERRIPYIKWGHLLRFDMGEISKWVDANRVQVGRIAFRRDPQGPPLTRGRTSAGRRGPRAGA
jgi:excisionase family DNA binding protein